ncbi:cyclase family protein [bacterium]|nr:cyclase family protein [bacterium]
MIGRFEKDGKPLQTDLNRGKDISISLSRNDGVASFDIQHAEYKDYESGGFIGNVNRGGACNLETITFTAHGNGTHTECVGHISKETYYVNDFVEDIFYKALLVTIKPTFLEEDRIIDLSILNTSDLKQHEALIVRTLPNLDDKRSTNYSGRNAPYILPEHMQQVVDAGIKHFLIDLPSVDKEWDGGVLASHHVFWNYPEQPRMESSITEFIYVEDEIQDGSYALKLNISPFNSDAAPSKPTLYPLL